MTQRQHALVIGGSIAGLLAARVLSDHFERVTIVDRDYLSDSPEPRKGVPQATHVHVLLRRGMLIMRRLLPELDNDLTQAGAHTVNWTADLAIFSPAGWGPRFPSNLTTRTCSRGLLEGLIRRHVGTIKNISFEPRCEAIDLLVDESQATITGVKVRYRDRVENNIATFSGDLVVDASGRSSRSLDWLEARGYVAPEETVINAFVGYATRVYRRPPDFRSDWKALFVRTRPPFGLRGGLIYPIENDQWMVNLVGAGNERPPTDDGSFLEFTRTLIHPAVYDAVKGAEPVSPTHGYQRTENRLRHFERLRRWPDHFLVIGDAACAFNPTYGQGMTVAALEAEALDRWLHTSRTSSAFQKEIIDVVHMPWLLATNEDSRLSGVQNVKLRYTDRLTQRYIDEVIWLAAHDQLAFETFMAVTQLVKPPSAFLQPKIALKVARRMIRREKPDGRASDPIPPAPR